MSRSILSQVRRAAWRTSSLTGDLEAAARGPVPLAKRMARKAVYRKSGAGTRRLLRGLGLG